jgi:beta-galactosidase/beta-glucuronidase
MFKKGYDDTNWVTAIVPGTVFTSYVNGKLENDPNFSDNIYKVDKSKYDRNFWYRLEFKVPMNFSKEKIWVNFKGINRRGKIFLNGYEIGLIDGFMAKGIFDITPFVKKQDTNVLSILVFIPEQPMANFASPTYIASGGWDWMPYVPGLNSGITDKVFLSNTGKVILEDTWIRTLLPTNSKAYLEISSKLKNTSNEDIDTEIFGIINPGNITFSKKVRIQARKKVDIILNKNEFNQLIVNNPNLWWPNGYGSPNLYSCKIMLKTNGILSDEKDITFGIRQYSYDTEGGVLHIKVNGERVFLKGGNWGMSEYMLRVRGKDYDTRVRLHKEMNFNIIRNWLGHTTDEEFYDA